jgi:hypothetical protein
VVGATVVRPEFYGGIYELGAAAMLREYAGRGHFVEVYDSSILTVIERPDCNLVYGYARTQRSQHVFAHSRIPPFWTGTDGGMHLVGSDREEHLVGLFYNPHRSITRITPRTPLLDPNSVVARDIAQMGAAHTGEGDYPATIISGGQNGRVYETSAGRVRYSFNELSRAARFDAIEADSPADMRRALWETVDKAPENIEHITVNVLADKTTVMTELNRPDSTDPRRRLVASAYMPSWHEDGDARYDCVTMTALLDGRTPQRLGFDDDVVESLYKIFLRELR